MGVNATKVKSKLITQQILILIWLILYIFTASITSHQINWHREGQVTNILIVIKIVPGFQVLEKLLPTKHSQLFLWDFAYFCISDFLPVCVLFSRVYLLQVYSFVCLPPAGWGRDKMRSLWKNDGAESFHLSSDGPWHINGPPGLHQTFSYFSNLLLSHL